MKLIFLIVFYFVSLVGDQGTSMINKFSSKGSWRKDAFKFLYLNNENTYKLIIGTVTYGSSTADSGTYSVLNDSVMFLSLKPNSEYSLNNQTLFLVEYRYRKGTHDYMPYYYKSEKNSYLLLDSKELIRFYEGSLDLNLICE